jgi:hypothetical protein
MQSDARLSGKKLAGRRGPPWQSMAGAWVVQSLNWGNRGSVGLQAFLLTIGRGVPPTMLMTNWTSAAEGRAFVSTDRNVE